MLFQGRTRSREDGGRSTLRLCSDAALIVPSISERFCAGTETCLGSSYH